MHIKDSDRRWTIILSLWMARFSRKRERGVVRSLMAETLQKAFMCVFRL